ncbi:hypothetical protein BGZ46_006002 [Entomortierella lignicola]|nr:hypothetical protein BGZ46_006002 [Entomortierella lignicola]
MNPTPPPPESFLSINDLFLKAKAQSNTDKRRRILSFKGTIVHSISNTNLHNDSTTSTQNPTVNKNNNSNTQIIKVPSDPARFPIHQHAMRMFKKLHNGTPPDHIIWLYSPPKSPIASNSNQAPRHSLMRRQVDRKNQKETKEPNDHVVYILDSDDDQSQENNNGDNDNASEISWSDSDRGSNSESDSESVQEITQFSAVPSEMVAVLLNDSFLDQGNNDGDQTNSSSVISFTPGKDICVSKAVMLSDDIEGKALVSFIGIQGQSRFWIMSPSTNDEVDNVVKKDYSLKTKKRTEPEDMGIAEQQDGYGEPKKRSRVSSPTVEIRDIIDLESLDNLKSPRKVKPSAIVEERSYMRVAASFQQSQLQEIDPLELLVRGGENSIHLQGTTNSESNDAPALDYFSNIWSNVTHCNISAVNTTSDSTTSLAAIDAKTESERQGRDVTTRHICWLTGVRSVVIRAICYECENDYKRRGCIFYCRSHKWRVKIHMECSVSDGTAEATLLVPEDREDIMWTLLGLMKKTNGITNNTDISTISSDPKSVWQGKNEHRNIDNRSMPLQPNTAIDQNQDVRDKVLRILARRGTLSYKVATPVKASSQKNIPGPASRTFVEATDNHQTHQEKMEDKLWFNICSAHSKKRETFLLHATMTSNRTPVVPYPSNSSSTLSTRSTGTSLSGGAENESKLKTSVLWMNRRTMIQTLVRPPLEIKAIDLEWIKPRTEAMILLDRLHLVSV